MNQPPQPKVQVTSVGAIIDDARLTTHDLLMIALASLKRRQRTREVAIVITELEKIIAYHQTMNGIEVTSVFDSLHPGHPDEHGGIGHG